MWLIYLLPIFFQAKILLASNPGQYRTAMVVTGYDGGDHDTTQLIDLTSSTKSCQNWNNYPIALSFATGGMVSGSPLVCGGFSSSRHEQCYTMDIKKKSWKFLTNMTTKRSSSASAVVNNALLIAGGKDDNGDRLQSSEYIHADGQVSAGPDLPSPRSGHCMVALPSGKVIIMGGWPEENFRSVLSMDNEANSFNTSLPPLIHDRVAGCAVFKSPAHNLRPVVLAVGGTGQATAEVLDVTKQNSKWEEIPSLPTNHDSSFVGARAITIPSGQGVIVQHNEHIYQLECQKSGCSWSILKQNLRQSVRHAVLFALPEEYTCD